MATGSFPISPLAADFPDETTSNLAPGVSSRKGTQGPPAIFVPTIDFDGGGRKELCFFSFVLPANYASGGTLNVRWQANATTGDCKWQAQVGAVTPADVDTVMEHAFAAAATVTTTTNATEARRLNSSSITLTMDGAAAGDIITIMLFRDSADAADTLAVDAELLGAEFTYTLA